MRIGVFGGVFDPIHSGHAAVVRAALKSALDRVVLVPGPQSTPLREAVAPARERIRMCELLARSDARIDVCRFEALSQTPVLSFQTIAHLQKQFPRDDFTLLLGADKLEGLRHWEKREKLFPMCDFLCFERAGVLHAEALQRAREAGARVQMLSVPITPGSSPVIRARVAAYEEAPDLPASIAVYIAQNGLYHGDELLRVREGMSDKRFRHTLGVRYEAVRLADLHGIPLQKAQMAAMLHDCAKDLPLADMQELSKAAGISDSGLLSSPALLHGPAGAYLAKTKFHVTDEDVLNAIRSHTVGRAGMSPLETLIFVADATEPGRESYAGLDRLRKLSEMDLCAAALLALNLTRDYLRQKKKPFDPISLQTAAWLTTAVPPDLLYLTKTNSQ